MSSIEARTRPPRCSSPTCRNHTRPSRVAWAVLALARDFGGYEITYPKMIVHGFSLLGMLGAAIYLGRRSLLQNDVSRRMAQSISAMLGGALIFRFVAWMMDIAVMGAIALELLFLSVSAVVLALALDRRVLWAAIPYVLCVIIAAFFPEYLLYIFSGTNIVAMGLLAWRLWPESDES